MYAVGRLRRHELVLDPVVADVDTVRLKVDAAPAKSLSLAGQTCASVEACEQEREHERVVNLGEESRDLVAVVEVVATQDAIVIGATAGAGDLVDDVSRLSAGTAPLPRSATYTARR
jgi:hypothetical protein